MRCSCCGGKNVFIVIQWQYGACISQRRSAFPHKSSWRSNQSGRNCGVQDWGQRDPHCAQSAQNSWEVSKVFDANFTDFESKHMYQHLCFSYSIYIILTLWCGIILSIMSFWACHAPHKNNMNKYICKLKPLRSSIKAMVILVAWHNVSVKTPHGKCHLNK